MSRIAFIAAACALLMQPQAWAGTPYKIVTADPRGTYFSIGNDLAQQQVVAKPATACSAEGKILGLCK